MWCRLSGQECEFAMYRAKPRDNDPEANLGESSSDAVLTKEVRLTMIAPVGSRSGEEKSEAEPSYEDDPLLTPPEFAAPRRHENT